MKDYAAVFDIGSNAVRLVIYGGPARAPMKIHNERNICGLGAGLPETGHLNPEAVDKALDSLRRFAGLVRALGISRVHAVATAAVRDASDGAAFLQKVKKECNVDITVIDGAEEARLAALGVVMNGLGASGLIGDYGGGSLELMSGDMKQCISLPIGSHRLHSLSTRAQKIKSIDAALDTVDFLSAFEKLPFTALGGAWRSLGKAHMHFSRYPLRVLDHYTVSGKRGMEFATLLSQQSPASLEKTVGINRKRASDVGAAALVMERLFHRLQPQNLTFSGSGLREGVLFDFLSPAKRKPDPLIVGCAALAARTSRLRSLDGQRLMANWMMPLFDQNLARLIEASCLLSDCAGFAHEDWQAAQAFQHTLVYPFYGASHEERTFLAIAQYVRHKGYLRRAARARDDEDHTRGAQRILGQEMTGLAVQDGLAMRAATMLTGGALPLLQHTALAQTPEKITLTLKKATASLNAETVRKAFTALAAETGRAATITVY